MWADNNLRFHALVQGAMCALLLGVVIISDLMTDMEVGRVGTIHFSHPSQPDTVASTKQLAIAPWPMFQHDPQHTGRSPYNTSMNPGTEKWNFSTGDRIAQSSPSIGPDGTIYIGSMDKKLYAIYPNGTKKWSFTTGGWVTSSPAIASDGTIYVGSYDNNLYAIYPNGTKKWSFATGGVVEFSPAISPDGIIYIGSRDGNLYAINPDGSERWHFSIPVSGITTQVKGSPAIGPDGTIYVGSNKLYALYPNGTLKWSYPSASIEQYFHPAIGPDGAIYVGCSDHNLYALNPDGTEKWTFATGDYVLSCPAIGADGTIYATSYDGNLYAINPDGGEKWHFNAGDIIESSPAIASEGTIYFGCYDNKLYAINPKGWVEWAFTTGSYVLSSPTIGPKGTVYIGSYDHKLYAIGPKEPSAPENLTATPGEGHVILSWYPPMNDGGAPITNYTIYRGSTSGGEMMVISVIGNVLTYNDTNVTNGVTYYYAVSAVNIAGEGPKSAEVSAMPFGKPSAPKDLMAEGGDAIVSLSWSPPDTNGGRSIVGYNIYRGTLPGNVGLIAELGNITFYTDKNVTNGVTYYYAVSAVNSVGEGQKSNEVSATPLGSGEVPGQPRDLQVSASENQVLLWWRPPETYGTEPITAYKIYRGQEPGGETLFDTIGNVTSYTDTNVTNNVTYYYQVSAVNDVGEGPRSKEVSVSISAKPGVPGPPRELTASGGNEEVVLSWSPPLSDGGADIVHYRIYRGTSSDNKTAISTVDNVLTYTDTNVKNGITYYYAVSAMNSVGEGPRSNEVSAKPIGPPNPPQELQVKVGDRYVLLSWLQPASDGGSPVTAYTIYRSLTPGSSALLAKISGSETLYNDTSVTPGNTYYYSISASNSVGEGPRTAEVVAHVPIPNTPPTTRLLSPPNTSIVAEATLTWLGTDDDGDDITYSIYLNEKRDLVEGHAVEAIIENAYSGTEYKPAALVEGKTYYWTVIPNDGKTLGKCLSGVWSFTINTTASPGIDVALELDASNLSLNPGDNYTGVVTVVNNNNESGKIGIEVGGDLKEYTALEKSSVSIREGGKEYIEYYINIPDDMDSGEYALVFTLTANDMAIVSKALKVRVTTEQINATDTDGDGIPDYLDSDDDNDGLSDILEKDLGTDPLKPDSDGDGVSDLEEFRAGSDPTNPEDKPGSDKGVSNWWGAWEPIVTFLTIIISFIIIPLYGYYRSQRKKWFARRYRAELQELFYSMVNNPEECKAMLHEKLDEIKELLNDGKISMDLYSAIKDDIKEKLISLGSGAGTMGMDTTQGYGAIGPGLNSVPLPGKHPYELPGGGERDEVMELIKVKWDYIKTMRDMGVDTREAEAIFAQARNAFKMGDYDLAKEHITKAVEGVNRAFKDFKKGMERELKEDEKKDYYEILGVPRTATKAEIKRAYRKRISEYHPDKVAALGPKLKTLAEKEAKLINEAYETLCDDEKRAEYDKI